LNEFTRPEPGFSTARPLNVSYRIGRIADLLSGRWLDLGCADGGYASELLRRGAAEVVGVDADEDRVAAARARDLPHASFEVALAENLPFPDWRFDGVFMNEVFEHVGNEAAALAEVARVLKPNGVLVLISPNRWFPFEGHGMRTSLWTVGVRVPLLPWLPRRLASRWMRARNYWPRELVKSVTRAGLKVQSCEFIWPVLEESPWLPAGLRASYQRNLSVLDRTPGLRHFGVSTMVIARHD
jgi:SAM-dependent methyltransferase